MAMHHGSMMSHGSELWRQCVEWLIECGVLALNHRSRQPHADVFDLAQTLRDGVVLCKLINIIHPGCFEDAHINLNSQLSQFLCLQNIRAFINTVQDVFGIPKVFEPTDLYNMTGFPMVLQCLSEISRTPQAIRRFRPFPHSIRCITDESENDIYKLLPDLASERDLADEEEDLYDCVPEEKDEGIYGSLIDMQKRPPPNLKQDKRSCCIMELVETESNYVSHLRMMKEEFIDQLHLSSGDQRKIFINIEDLLPIHDRFKAEIDRLLKQGNNAQYSKVFLTYKEKFLIYGTYCSHLVDALDYLEAMMKNNSFRQRIEECQIKSSQNKFKLRELLCVPMQRVLKYHLLVKELNKHTGTEHVDKQDLQTAISSMQELSGYVNEVKRDNEELIKINLIESSLNGYDANSVPLNEYGRVHKDGELKIRLGTENPKVRNVFLFDRAIFITKMRNDSYLLKMFVSLEDMKLDEMVSSGGKAKWTASWQLVGNNSQGHKGLTFFAKTQSEKNKWVDGTKTALENLSPRALRGKSHNFVMHTFSGPSYCNVCLKLLKGTFYQGYFCKVTKMGCHKECLAEALNQINNNNYSAQTTDDSQPPPVPQRGRMNPAPLPKNNNSAKSKYYQAHRDYHGSPPPPFKGVPGSTSFKTGEKVEVLQQVNSEWWIGRPLSSLETGYFPSSYVSFPNEQNQSSHSKRPLSVPVNPFKLPIANPNEYTNGGLPDEPSLNRFGDKRYSVNKASDYNRGTPFLDSIDMLNQQIWFATNCDRKGGERLLQGKPTGTFLVRDNNGHRALSIVFGQDIKHIKINKTNDNMHYVAECKNFRSIQALVQYYQNNSLSSSFLGLETCLQFPYRDQTMFPGSHRPPIDMLPAELEQLALPNHSPLPQQIRDRTGRVYDIIGHASVLFDFEPRSAQELALQANRTVNIISKKGSSHGWWKGAYEGEVGYFPKTFVQEINQ